LARGWLVTREINPNKVRTLVGLGGIFSFSVDPDTQLTKIKDENPSIKNTRQMRTNKQTHIQRKKNKSKQSKQKIIR
jgi:hypothetical protein